MRKLLALAVLLALGGIAWGQTVSWPPPAGTQAILCVFNTTEPTWSSTNVGFVQCDSHGNIITAVSGGSVTANNPIGITPTDHTLTSATGVSQTLMAANASRHSLNVENTGSSNCGVNPTGGTAAIGGAGTLTLAPFGSYSPKIPTLSAVTTICTAGQPLYADEN